MDDSKQVCSMRCHGDPFLIQDEVSRRKYGFNRHTRLDSRHCNWQVSFSKKAQRRKVLLLSCPKLCGIFITTFDFKMQVHAHFMFTAFSIWMSRLTTLSVARKYLRNFILFDSGGVMYLLTLFRDACCDAMLIVSWWSVGRPNSGSCYRNVYKSVMSKFCVLY